jgi:hypothetical protein
VTAVVLSLLLVAMIIVDASLGATRTKRALAALGAASANRIRFYRRLIAVGWIRAAAAILVALAAGLSPAEIGLSGPGSGPIEGIPDGEFLAWPLAVFYGVCAAIGSVRLRRHMRAGKPVPYRAKISNLIPRTADERRYATGVAFTAGITEEILFRGALIALGLHVFDLPLTAVAALSLLLFAACHLYQGRQGTVGSAFLGLVFTILTLMTGSLLPAIAVHIAIDLLALLVVPAEPTPRPVIPPDSAPHSVIPPESVARPVVPADSASLLVSPVEPADDVAVADPPLSADEQREEARAAAPTVRPAAPTGYSA